MYTGATISNRADWIQEVICTVSGTDDPVDMTGASVVLGLRRLPPAALPYGADYGRGYWTSNPDLSGSTESEEITVGLGFIRWRFPASQMSNLAAGSYELGVTVSRDGLTTQLLLGTLPIVDGVVRS